MTRNIPIFPLLYAVFCLLVARASAFDISLLWEVPEDAIDITQGSAHVTINKTSSPIGTEWIGVGWETGAISLQKLSDDQLVAILQVRAPSNDSSVHAGRVTEYAKAHYIDKTNNHKSKNGVYLESKIDADSAESQGYSLKVIAHYNMISNNTIYQGLWSDGKVWTYMGSIVLQHPKTGSIKEEVAKALEEAAKADSHSKEGSKSIHTVGDNSTPSPTLSSASAAVRDAHGISSVPPTKDPLSGVKAPEVLATCDINRESGTGVIKPVCRFIKQLPIIPSFKGLFSAIRRTQDGSPKVERSGVWKDLMLKSRLAKTFEITTGRCVSHNRRKGDAASCQRDPNNPEFLIAIDGERHKDKDGDKPDNIESESATAERDVDQEEEGDRMRHAVSKHPEFNGK
ncbi:hypothetical protein GGI12_001995 [Dipsacomyces acuminosporus]|nr:hypothetical protein GGI12_001995 [Dipsacomyces acuminosporus]